jgi:DNA-binding CsgD family transcriptional regulator
MCRVPGKTLKPSTIITMYPALFNQRYEQLTRRRKEVLHRLLKGEKDEDIAISLDIKQATVRKHVEEICKIFGLKNKPGERYPQRPKLIELFRDYKPELVQADSSPAVPEVDIITDKSHLVAIMAMAGVGKTTLTQKLAEQIPGEFDYIIWCRLREKRPAAKIIADFRKFLSHHQEIDLLIVSEKKSPG